MPRKIIDGAYEQSALREIVLRIDNEGHKGTLRNM
jgi:hypothetical protein